MGKRSCYTWIFSTLSTVLFKCGVGRGKVVLTEVLGEEFDGIGVTDDYSAYQSQRTSGPLGGDGPEGRSHQQDRFWSEATWSYHERSGEPFETPRAFHVGQCLVGNQPLVRNRALRLSGRTRCPSSGDRRCIQRTSMRLWRFRPRLPPAWGGEKWRWCFPFLFQAILATLRS